LPRQRGTTFAAQVTHGRARLSVALRGLERRRHHRDLEASIGTAPLARPCFTVCVLGGRREQRIRSGATVVLAISVAALVAACGGSSHRSPPRTAQHTSHTASASTTPSSTSALPALVSKVQNGIIRIETSSCGGGEIGTGFLIGRRLVATVEHVVDGATHITLKRNGVTLGSGVVIGEDRARDVALIQTSRPIEGPLLNLATRSPGLGESVTTLGFPLGLPLTVTQGDVSGLNRTIPIDGVERRDLVQTDAAINPGNSGGPLISLSTGEVIGLVDLGTNQANGISFAVSAQVAQPLLRAWQDAPQPLAPASCATQSTTQPATTTPTTSTPTTTTPSTSIATYTGHAFSIEYPASWTIVSAEQQYSWGTDTTIEDPSDPSVLIRVDVSTNPPTTDLRALAQPQINMLEQEPGYQLIGITPSQAAGFSALDWEFTVDEQGVLLQKEDVFFIDSDNGDSVGVLTQAPASVYAGVASAFALLRDTLVMN
jgi:hypothetical protein